jgi:hypothetical protein
MLVHWLLPIDGNDPGALADTPIASTRLRAGALRSFLHDKPDRLAVGDTIAMGAQVCVVGKIGKAGFESRHALWLKQLEPFRAGGGKVVLDYTDNHLEVESLFTPFYRRAVEHADAVVAASELLRRSVARHFAGPTATVPDAIEVAIRPPKEKFGRPPRALWFGHDTNLPFLFGWLPKLQVGPRLELSILTSPYGLQLVEKYGAMIPRTVALTCGQWSKPLMEETAADCDLCLIPSDPNNPRKAGVSANRLLTALALGLPTCASLLDSYLPFRDYFADIDTAECERMLKKPGRWRPKILQAQAEVLADYTPERIGGRWFDHLRRAVQGALP